MMELIDLHTHSTFSDGTFSPSELVDLALARGVKILALTDHDTVDGIAEAEDRARGRDIVVVPGIEISAMHENLSLHLLGYFLHYEDPALIAGLRKLQEARHDRNIRIVEKLNALGLQVSMDEVQAFSVHGQTGRPHIARLLTEKGLVKNVDMAFVRYLRKGAAAYVERCRFGVQDALRLIHDAGGMTVLAHPVQLDSSMRIIPGLLQEMKALGLQGVEVYYPGYTPKLTRRLIRLADELGLHKTGGSDFHGDVRHGKNLGMVDARPIPVQLYEGLIQEGFDLQGKEVA